MLPDRLQPPVRLTAVVDDRGYADVPVTSPLTDLEIAKRLPTLGLFHADHRPHIKGEIPPARTDAEFANRLCHAQTGPVSC